jgi:glycosyltransferase involved in cell wall biosynthesis
MRILLLTSGLGYSGSARQLTLLATGLPREHFETRVCVLGRDGPFGECLRQAGLAVDVLGWTRIIDALPIVQLRRLVHDFQPKVIHAWGLPALRAAVFLGQGVRRLISFPVAAGRGRAQLNRFDQWLLQRADGVTALNAAQATGYEQVGFPKGTIQLIPPGVAAVDVSATPRSVLCRSLNVPEPARFLVCVGPFEPRKGYRDALWAFDILKYVYDDLHLLLIGDGPERQRLDDFARATSGTERARFLGVQADVHDWLALADVVWVPSLADGGLSVTLEAMVAGRAVVAGKVPLLADIIADGQTGYLVEPGDQVALARQTRSLLEGPELRRRFGEAAKKRAAERFSVRDMIERHCRWYRGEQS